MNIDTKKLVTNGLDRAWKQGEETVLLKLEILLVQEGEKIRLADLKNFITKTRNNDK